jgi:hypothetical protein
VTRNAPDGSTAAAGDSFLRRNREPLRLGALIGLWVASAIWVWLLTAAQGPRGPEGGWVGIDSFAYWYAWDHDLYAYDDIVQPGAKTGRYLYSPAFAQALWPLTLLPWQVFAWLWTLVMAAVFLWLLRPLPWVWRVPAFVLLCLEEVILGNVRALVAAALVLALRRPVFWALPLLTKVASGIGVLWHPLRGEWRRFFTALATVAVVVAVSVAISPALWVGWLQFLQDESLAPTDGYALAAGRWAAALVLVVVAARWGRAEWLAPATALASPVIYLADLSLLAAMPRLRRETTPRPGSADVLPDPPAERPASTHG